MPKIDAFSHLYRLSSNPSESSATIWKSSRNDLYSFQCFLGKHRSVEIEDGDSAIVLGGSNLSVEMIPGPAKIESGKLSAPSFEGIEH